MTERYLPDQLWVRRPIGKAVPRLPMLRGIERPLASFVSGFTTGGEA